MKKHLIAAAVAAAVAAPAMAQNVSIYGIIDAGVAVLSNTNAAGDSTTSVNSRLLNTSRLGVRGTEDLGGGMKARFTLEGALNNDTGGMGAGFNSTSAVTTQPTGSQAQKLFDRQATVGLEFGTTSIDIGRQNNLIASFGGSVDPLGYTFAAYNYNVSQTGLGALANTGAFGSTSHVASATNSVNDLFRLDNSVRVSTSAGGLNLAAMHAVGESATGGGNGSSNALGASGKFGDATVSGAYQTVEAFTASTTLKGYIVGVALPVGGFTLKATTGQQKANDPTIGRTSVWSMGVSTKVSAPGAVNLVYYNVDNNSTTANRAGDVTQWGAVYTHDLSKRTALYGAGFQRSYGGAADGSNFRTAGLRDSDTLFAAGVSHSF